MDFAIVGMDCVLPGSDSAEAWIAAGRAGEVHLSEIPPGRWPLPVGAAVDGTIGRPDATPTARGGFVSRWGLPTDLEAQTAAVFPDFSTLDPLHAWVLKVTHGATLGVQGSARTDLLLANLALPSTGAVRAWSAPLRTALADRCVEAPFLSGGSPWDTLPADFPAQLAARVLGFQGHVAALDAACASGLYAVRLACDRLEAGLCDVAIAAAANRADSAFLFFGFAQLRALSPSGRSRPFHREADGLLVAEGAAAVALKRLDDARRDGDRIHAIVRGAGIGNDGKKGNLLAPNPQGQARAMRAAWRRAGLDPRTLGYVECHATGTPTGDRSELEALAVLLDERGGFQHPLALGSAKANIGHAVTAAGLAGLIRAVGAVRDGILPPTPCDAPLDHIDGRRFWIPSEATDWDGPRRAAVSAFGFGGTNAHVILDAPDESAPPRPTRTPAAAPPQALAVVAVSARIGGYAGAELATALKDRRTLLAPAGPEVARGLEPAEAGTYFPAIELDSERFRLPPVELRALLLQQAAFLEVAANAFAAAPAAEPERIASMVGMSIDPEIANSTARWCVPEPLRDAIAPALNASRVQGVLPNFVANRVAALLDLQGPSYSVFSGSTTIFTALEHAERLLAEREVDFAIVGAVDGGATPGEVRARRERGDEAPPGEAAVAFVVARAEDAEANGWATHGLLRRGPTAEPHDIDHHTRLGHCGAADAAVALLDRWAFASAPTRIAGSSWSLDPATGLHDALRSTLPARRPVRVERGGPTLPLAPFAGSFGALAPLPRPRRAEPVERVAWNTRVEPPAEPLNWLPWMPEVTAAIPAPMAPPAAAASVSPPSPTAAVAELQAIAALTEQLARAHAAVTEAHAAYLADQLAASGYWSAMRQLVDAAAPRLLEREVSSSIPVPTSTPGPLFDRAALERFAAGKLSDALGPAYADLDAYEPRTRLPTDPLLLVSRVLAIEGSRGTLGRSRIITEYDIPADAWWSHDGKAPPCVVVESGQADLFLVSWLGIEAICKGKRLYRLLDCDLTFHGPRPVLGTTLRHDIRIDRFARLGETTLFYFQYDATDARDGRPVLTMRQGVAGFFTPGELARPQGVRPPDGVPAGSPPAPLLGVPPTYLDEAAVEALAAGRYSDAFGPGFVPADGSTLTLPRAPWRLLHRVRELRLSGGPHGLGIVRAEQDLRDDDWFNACHFVGDPCMPGTLMFDGCVQALQVWLMALGVPSEYPEATFEPIPGRTTRLRCRGQVVPGQHRLEYEVRIKEAGLEPRPYAVADVILHVDGTAVVRAENVGVQVEGARHPRAAAPPSGPTQRFGEILEFAVGLPSRAFGSRFLPFDGDLRTPRIPGPPYLTMSRIAHADGPPGEVAAGRSVTVEYDLPSNAWFFDASPGTDIPFAVLTEIALQPCGWFTAWQGAAMQLGGDVYFRNLSGKVKVHAPIHAKSGTLVTRATMTSVSRSAGMMLHAFRMEMRAGERLVLEGETQFGYFTAASLAQQKGLGLTDDEEQRRAACREASNPEIVDLREMQAVSGVLPRSDLRMIDRVVAAGPAQGAHGLGYYVAEKDVRPHEWFFAAHFHQDPVMPGSLGLEGLAQLARWVLEREVGVLPGIVEPVASGTEVVWKYRGQVPPTREKLTFELEVREIQRGGAPRLIADGLVRGDGLPIYELRNLTVGVRLPEGEPPRPASHPRDAVAALLDRFTVDGNRGHGILRLDPEVHPWLADHCPTVVIPALPMAFAAEIAAEAAQRLDPDRRIVGIPRVDAEKWIHTAEGPTDLLIDAVRDGDLVQVTLSIFHENERFPKLSGPVPHMRATVQLGTEWPTAPAAPEWPTAGGAMSAADYYGNGLTFHGPLLQGMVDVGTRDARGATARFRAVADETLLPPGSPPFLLDPRLLDTATHPMRSGEPEVWVPGLQPGKLAYPVRCDDLVFYGPRPTGDVGCRLDVCEANARILSFNVTLWSDAATWCTFRWTEALVDGGPVLGQAPALRRGFCWDNRPHPEVCIGRPTEEGWKVEPSDLVEPIPGTLLRLYATDAERAEGTPAIDRIAAKEAVRDYLRARIGRDVHPRRIVLADRGDGTLFVVEAPDLDAQTFIDQLGPVTTRVRVHQGVATVAS